MTATNINFESFSGHECGPKTVRFLHRGYCEIAENLHQMQRMRPFFTDFTCWLLVKNTRRLSD
jgi:hypothetical protein